MISGGSILVSLVCLVDHLPFPPSPVRRQRGRPQTYSDRLLMKALVVMIIRRLYTAWALLAFLHQEDPVVQQLRALLIEEGRFPTRRTWEPGTGGGTAGSCTWPCPSATSGFRWRPSSRPLMSLTVRSRRCCSPSCRRRSAMSWVTNIIIPLTSALSVPGTTANWWQLAAGPIPILTAGSKSAGCFINCARTRLNPSMACSKTSLSGAATCRSKAYVGVNSWHSEPFCSTNWSCSLNTNITNPLGLASKRFSARRDL